MPALSVVGQDATSPGPQGGPTVPCVTVKLVETVPVELVETSWLSEGGLQPTGTGGIDVLSGTLKETVGSSGAMLHSSTAPIVSGLKPLPVTETLSPALSPVDGLTDIDGPAGGGVVGPFVATTGQIDEPAGAPVADIPDGALLFV